MDILGISAAQSIGFSVYFISGVMDLNDRDAGDLFLLCPKKSTRKGLKHICLTYKLSS